MALLTIEQLEEVMGRSTRPFNENEEGTANFVIDAVTAFVSSRCAGIGFSEVTVTDERMQADFAGVIELPYFPVTDITSVKNARDGLETTWDWDDWDTIFDLDPFEVVLVTFEYGYASPPDDLVTVAKGLAWRIMSNPLLVRQQTVGAISETLSGGFLTEVEKEILGRYQPIGSSLRLGPQTARNLRRLPTL